MFTVIADSNNEKKFPKIMISTSGTIVLFYESGKGTCLKQGNTRIALGEHYTAWSMEYFTDYEGPITLENK